MTFGGATCVTDVAGALISGVHHEELAAWTASISLAAELYTAHPNGGLGVLLDQGWTRGATTLAEDVFLFLFRSLVYVHHAHWRVHVPAEGRVTAYTSCTRSDGPPGAAADARANDDGKPNHPSPRSDGGFGVTKTSGESAQQPPVEHRWWRGRGDGAACARRRRLLSRRCARRDTGGRACARRRPPHWRRGAHVG